MTSPRTLGKIITGFVVLPGFFLPLHAQNPNLLQPHDVVAIAGDGGQFSKLVGAYVVACQPVEKVQVWIFGDRGATSQEISDSGIDDMLLFRPTVGVLCCGLKEGNHPNPDAAILDGYRDRLTQAVRKLKNGVRPP